MESPPSYNEAMATAPPADFGNGIPPKVGGGVHQRPVPPAAGFTVPPRIPARTEPVTETYEPLRNQTISSVLGPKPTSFRCPTCQKSIITSTETEANTRTHVFALILFIVGCWPCCLIPYCVDSCMTIRHSCPSCGVFIGNYSN